MDQPRDLDALAKASADLQNETRAASLKSTRAFEATMSLGMAENGNLVRALRRLLRSYGAGDGVLLIHFQRHAVHDDTADEQHINAEVHYSHLDDLDALGVISLMKEGIASHGLLSPGKEIRLDELGNELPDDPDGQPPTP